MRKQIYNEKAILLLSGGQDSTTCLYWAKDQGYQIQAIGFDYGQMHRQEIDQARKIAEDAEIPFTLIDVRGLLGSSSLTDHSDHNQASHINPDLPASFTAGRNLLFLIIAASFGAQNGIRKIITGVCQTDFSGYPDCRRQTMDAMQLALTLGLGIGDVEIITPLMYLDKAETWGLAQDLGILDIIKQDTLTDYDGDMSLHPWGRGNSNNPATQLRKKGYLEAIARGLIKK